MNNKVKIAAGASGVSVAVLILHLLHAAHTLSTIDQKGGSGVFQNATVTIIVTDSTGKKDTMLMEDYLKKKR